MKDARSIDRVSEEKPDTPILCSSCFDNTEWARRILAIIPQSKCAICEKRCLGYQTLMEK